MPVSPPSFLELVSQVADGSESAIEQLVSQFEGEVYRVIRRQLHPSLRRQFDSQDFYQAIWASFIVHRDQIVRFRTPGELVAFLTVMARNKLADEHRRRFQTEKYNINREQSLADSRRPMQDALPARVSTPSEVVMAHEELASLAEGKPDHYRHIVELRTQGRTYNEIASELSLDPGSVRRILRNMIRNLDRNE